MTPLALAEDYIFAHDLRAASAKIYLAATKALIKNFGPVIEATAVDHRSILAWRKKVLESGLSKRSWNTYSNHLRTIWGYGIEHGLLEGVTANPFRKTTVIPPKRASKTVAGDAIQKARRWLESLADSERYTGERSRITPAWFWLATFEMFYYTGIRLNALLCLRLQDIDWDRQLILVRGDTEKTHREFFVPIMEGLAPHVLRILTEAEHAGFSPEDQLFNVNRFSRHYKRQEMNIDQVEAMYRKLTEKLGVRMTPHRFRHTLATDLMRQPERNIHLTKSLLNHSNIATTMGYIEADYDHMRSVLHERSLAQGAVQRVRRVDYSGAPPSSAAPSQDEQGRSPEMQLIEQAPGIACQAPGARIVYAGSEHPGHLRIIDSSTPPPPPEHLFEPTMLFSLLASQIRPAALGGQGRMQADAFAARASP